MSRYTLLVLPVVVVSVLLLTLRHPATAAPGHPACGDSPPGSRRTTCNDEVPFKERGDQIGMLAQAVNTLRTRAGERLDLTEQQRSSEEAVVSRQHQGAGPDRDLPLERFQRSDFGQ